MLCTYTHPHMCPEQQQQSVAILGSSRDRQPAFQLGSLVSVGSARVQGVHSLLHRNFVKADSEWFGQRCCFLVVSRRRDSGWIQAGQRRRCLSQIRMAERRGGSLFLLRRMMRWWTRLRLRCLLTPLRLAFPIRFQLLLGKRCGLAARGFVRSSWPCCQGCCCDCF